MKCKNLHPHNFSYFIYFFFIKTDQIFWGGFKRQKVDILCLTLVHLSFCFVRFFLGYSVDLAGQTVTELHATVMRELCSPGSGRCTRAWSFWISYSTLKPRHLAHEEHPRCCYKRPPAALGTRERGGGWLHSYIYIYIHIFVWSPGKSLHMVKCSTIYSSERYTLSWTEICLSCASQPWAKF